VFYADNKQERNFMVGPTNTIVVNYPNQRGDVGRYSLIDQRNYFSKFEGGSYRIFELALFNVVHGDLLAYTEQCEEIYDTYYKAYELQCSEIFDNLYLPSFEDNSIIMASYHNDRREFHRRIFDVYRYAKSSLAVLGPDPGFSHVTRLTLDHNLDSGSFILR
jgi:hypothetical protein